MIKHCFISALWAGLVALDITGVGPWLLTQPLVAGPLFGYLMGHVTTGLIIGGIVQLMWMDVTPVGVGIPYDAMAVSVLAIFWSTLPSASPLSEVALMVQALIIAVPFGSLFRRMDQRSRRINTHILHHIEKTTDEHLSAAISAGIVAGLVWNFLRYVVSYFLAMWAGAWLWKKMGSLPIETHLQSAFTMAAILLPVAGMSITLDLFLSEEPDARWLARLGFKTGTLKRRRSDQ